MPDRTLLRIGAVSLIAGVVWTIVSIGPEPGAADPDDIKTYIQA